MPFSELHGKRDDHDEPALWDGRKSLNRSKERSSSIECSRISHSTLEKHLPSVKVKFVLYWSYSRQVRKDRSMGCSSANRANGITQTRCRMLAIGLWSQFDRWPWTTYNTPAQVLQHKYVHDWCRCKVYVLTAVLLNVLDFCHVTLCGCRRLWGL
jgi:hypothetical protein